jgi:hypothetical protein
MTMQLESVVPFGRSLDEYVCMFTLTPAELLQNILGIGDGPASFNAEATLQQGRVTSIDPIYQFTGTEIRQQFDAVVDNIIDQVKATPQNWVWSYHQSPEHLRQNRERAIALFLQDYDRGKQNGRYCTGQLPQLDFPDLTFELALCSHFLFLYSDHFDYEFHCASILELLRVSSEVRIFPVLTLKQERSPHLVPLLAELERSKFEASVVRVPYELQKGGNEMLRVRQL